MIIPNVYRDAIEFQTQVTKKTGKTASPKTTFVWGWVENSDINKPRLDKIMATHDKCIKFNFKAPLNILLLWQKNKVTKHLLHCFHFELANQTWQKFLYLDDQ